MYLFLASIRNTKWLRNTKNQDALNNIAKFTVKHLCWSLFLTKLQAWWCTALSKRNSGQAFSCKFSEIFKKTYFVEHFRTDAWMKWTKKNCIYKIYSQEGTVKDVLTTFSKEIPSQMLLFENCKVLQKVIFTENWCATASDFL